MRVLSEQASIVHHFIAELRDKSIQQDSWRFRQNLSRLGEVMGYEISRELAYQTTRVETVLGSAQVSALRQQPVLVTVLRAGLPFFEGFQRMFDHAPSGFIGAYRSHPAGDSSFTIDLNYQAAPALEDQDVILVDPMLATGKSLVAAIQALQGHGKPRHWHLAVAIAAPEGVQYLKENIDAPYTLWIGALDSHLNEKSYIVPGLGDAGDLAYGHKQ
ncbi:MAG TPA: uracil phosphoribosyltransferase [Cytophagales bacterium]|nr:uracil phosphoribosyltransferase [Cytophagales bacterium]HAA22471.1 uracil phosphoribosyltransferase [Cytophagales bacterium]HAP63324.1 uracil phosphoribosyltransferase [Cytophagales bacterium]